MFSCSPNAGRIWSKGKTNFYPATSTLYKLINTITLRGSFCRAFYLTETSIASRTATARLRTNTQKLKQMRGITEMTWRDVDDHGLHLVNMVITDILQNEQEDTVTYLKCEETYR